MSIAYVLSTLVIGQPETPLTLEEANWSGKALFLVSIINALVLSYPILRSRWHGRKLIAALFLVQFGVETFMTQNDAGKALGIRTGSCIDLCRAALFRDWSVPQSFHASCCATVAFL